MRVLSLFDGMACGYEALLKAWIEIEKYYASEIDKYAIQIAMKNHPDIIQVGDVTKLKGEDFKDVDMIIGGSPCQGFSMAWKMLNFNDPRSKLFFEFVRLVKEIKPKYFLLENVKMKKEFQDVISEYMWVQPIEINSALLSAQNRKRLYRTNIPWIQQPQDRWILLKDILQDSVDGKYSISERYTNAMINARSSWKLNLPSPDGKCWTIIASYYKTPQDWPYIDERYYLTESQIKTINRNFGSKWKILNEEDWMIEKITYPSRINQKWLDIKCPTLTASMWTGGWNVPCVKRQTRIRKLTPIECERLQTMPDNYTEWVSDTQRYKMLWNWWTCDVIAHIFSFIKTDNG